MKNLRIAVLALLGALWLGCLGAAPAFGTEEQGAPVSLTPTQQYEANIFLSNFSEQSFWAGQSEPFESCAASEAALFDFAHSWAKINRRSAIGYSGSYEVMTREAVNDILERYLDRGATLKPADYTDYSVALGMGLYDWDRCWYYGGCFYYPAADGEGHPCFSVVTEKLQYPDKRCKLYFTVYELDWDIYWANDCVPADYYRLTPAEAAQLAQQGVLTPLRMGEATCSPLVLADSGRESYRLLSYWLYPLDIG